VSFENFDASTLTVDIKTTTTSDIGQPHIDEGKIQLQILVNASGEPVPCGTSGGIWVRFDEAFTDPPHVVHPSAGATSLTVELDVLGASCGDSVCIRAHYVTGGGSTKVATHFSAPTPFDIICQCTFTQGYWKTHGPDASGNNDNEWPAAVLSGGMLLGTVLYTADQLQDIFDTPPVGGNGLISLAHQLIAAKLNVANGVDGSAVASAIAAADALIGSLVIPPVGSDSLASSATGALTTELDNYNKGLTGPGHCGG
jgi:hypothetical protein